MKVLHVLHTTFPNTSGYAIRSKYIVDLQRELGLELAVVSSCRHPNNGATAETFDGVDYHRTDAPSSPAAKFPILRERAVMGRLYKRVLEVAREFRPDVIHAASPVLVGIPASRVAKQLGIPFVYEVRDLWENASVDKGKFGRGSLPYKIARSAETSLFRRADAVVAICQGLGKEIQSRGIPKDKIWLAPNGVDRKHFGPMAPDLALAKRHGLEGSKLIGYIGSFFRYEGLDTLISAMPAILAGCPSARLLMVGSGDEDARLKAQARELGIAERVLFTGRVPHGQVGGFYSLCDLLVYPRIDTATTRLTTPLKPLEAMAMGRVVVASDVAAMKELITDGQDGFLFRCGDAEHLAERCLHLLTRDTLRESLGERAQQTILETRDWRRIIQVYPAAYRQAAG